jgi:hypothetical protein
MAFWKDKSGLKGQPAEATIIEQKVGELNCIAASAKGMKERWKTYGVNFENYWNALKAQDELATEIRDQQGVLLHYSTDVWSLPPEEGDGKIFCHQCGGYFLPHVH